VVALGRDDSRVIAVRIGLADAAAFARLAKKLGKPSSGVALRELVQRALAKGGDVLGELLAVLKLPADATREQVLAAIDLLLPTVTPQGDDAMGDSADQPPKLSKSELAYCAKNKLTAEQFAKRKLSVAKNPSGGPRAMAKPAPRGDTGPRYSAAELALLEANTVSAADAPEFLANRRAKAARVVSSKK
jgi:hypothetical protein